MGDCSICLGPLFSHDTVPSSSQGRSATPRTAVQLGEPLSICALPCGHVFHASCSINWIQQPNRQARSCPLCRAACAPSQQLRLRFTGDPWAEERDSALKGSLARAARRLADKAGKTLGVDAHERTMTGFARDVEGTIELVKEQAEAGQEDGGQDPWLSLIKDPELKEAFLSLSSSVVALNGKLHYSHRVTSLHETVSKLEGAAAEHSEELRKVEAARQKAIKDYKAKTLDKMDRERARWKEKEAEREREWRGKEKSWEAKLALAEQRVREEVAEKRKLREDAASLDSSLNARLGSLNSLKQANAKLVSRLELSKQNATKLEDRIKSLEESLALAQSSYARRRTPAVDLWEEDEMDGGMDDSMEILDAEEDDDDEHSSAKENVTEDSLEITMNDISWRSEPEVFAVGRMRPFGQQPSKLSRLGATSSSSSSSSSALRPTPLRTSSSVNYPDPSSPPDKVKAASAFTSGPRHKLPPPKPKLTSTTIKSKVAEKGGQMRLDFSGGQGMQLALGERKRRRIDVVSGVL